MVSGHVDLDRALRAKRQGDWEAERASARWAHVEVRVSHGGPVVTLRDLRAFGFALHGQVGSGRVTEVHYPAKVQGH